VKYKDPTMYGENVTFGAGGGVVVHFDEDDSWLGSPTFRVKGNLTIKKDYYPWVNEVFMGGYKKSVSLLSEISGYYFKYQALQARSVYFEPVFHSQFITTAVWPKVKKEGSYVSYTYPDGSVEAIARAAPSFRKLEAIRSKAEAKK
jgi:hypothetical protein